MGCFSFIPNNSDECVVKCMCVCMFLDTVEKYFFHCFAIEMHKKQHATNICQRFVCQSLFDF